MNVDEATISMVICPWRGQLRLTLFFNERKNEYWFCCGNDEWKPIALIKDSHTKNGPEGDQRMQGKTETK